MNPGESIGPYVIINSLGSGGMGEVYRARDERLGREVALKRLSDATLTTDVTRRRVFREARAAAALSHPNIAAIFDVLDMSDGPTIVMEYVPGEPLARHITNGSMSPERALRVAHQIAEGLIEAHSHGIVHRDLKPANIQITPSGKVKILDFGIARSLEDERAGPGTATIDAGRIIGTVGYMSPEQLSGQSADQRSDVYALGVLLYEMLSGRAPFTATDLIGNALAVMQGDVPRVSEVAPEVPPHVSALVERAMAREPSQRYHTASDLAAAIHTAILRMSEAQTTALDHPDSNDGSTADRQRRLRAVVLTGLVVVLSATAWYSLRPATRPVVASATTAIAVLPFRNVSEDPADAPLAVGLTDSVANQLTSHASLRVRSMGDAKEAARTAPDDSARAARNLGATFVVEGKLRRSGETLYVDVSLVDGEGRHRPVGRYSGSVGQPLDLHRRVVGGVTAALARAGAVPSPVSGSTAPPTSNQEAFAEYAQAQSFLERPDVPQHLDHAIRLFQSAIAKDPRFALAHAGLGRAYWAQYHETQGLEWTSKATAAILDALKIDDSQPEVRMSLAVMYQGLGRLAAAEEELRRVIAAQPGNDDAYRLLAGIHIERGQWDEAVTHLETAIELRPNYWRNHSELGYVYYRAGRLDQSLKAYHRVVELQPDSARGFHMLGTVFQSAGRSPEALSNYAQANAIRPSASTYSNIGTIHFWTGDYRKAAEAYQHAIALAPNQPDLHANFGDVLQKLGRRDRARASYSTAVREMRQQLTVNENDALNVSSLAIYLAKLGDQEEADRAAQKALALSPQDAEVLYAAAIVNALAGRTTDACGRLDEALTRGITTEVARQSDELRVLKGCPAYDRIRK